MCKNIQMIPNNLFPASLTLPDFPFIRGSLFEPPVTSAEGLGFKLFDLRFRYTKHHGTEPANDLGRRPAAPLLESAFREGKTSDTMKRSIYLR